MHLDDLDLRDLLEPANRGGIHRFAKHSAVLLSDGALWCLRERLVRRVGIASAQTLLTHLGWAWGWEVADATERQVPWDGNGSWAQALPYVQSLVGLGSPLTKSWETRSGLRWQYSFEAHQQLRREGRSDRAACWILAGFAGGYLTRVQEHAMECHEDECIAMGHDACRLVISRREQDEQGEGADGCRELLQELRDVPAPAASSRKGPSRPSDEAAHALGVHSPTMRRVLDLATRVAPLDSTILITGESGVGKERLAEYIHESSRRRAASFVAINCGALTETLLESELFGHSRGAFTGAHQDRAGLFEAAERGTLFLDEIGEMPLTMQVKLLRVIQQREVRRLGENRSRRIDVRLIVATNRDLEQEVAAKRFRHDLYYRLRVVELHVPPLRERPDDLRALARSLLATAARQLPCDVTGFTPRALDTLLRYHWPGNVRELENAIERACALANGPLIDVDDLPEHVRKGSRLGKTAAAVRPLADVERDYIVAALAANDGNKAKTAEQLDIAPATLFRKLRRFGPRLATST